MSRWYLTSNEKVHLLAQQACERAGLRPSGYTSGGNHHGQAYLKRAVDTPTFVKRGESGWICAAGTIIYEGRLGSEALEDLYSDFAENGARAVQARAIGHYAVGIRCADSITIFTDPQGSLSLYYADTGSWWIVSNSLDVCARALPVLRIDPFRLAIMAIETYLPGEETFYSGIKRLFGSQMINIDVNDGRFKVADIPNPASIERSYSSIFDAVDQYRSEVRAIFRGITGVGSIGLFGTGGMDSRTVLSALLDQGALPQIMYMVGNSDLTDDRTIDLEIAANIARTFSLPFQRLDWSGEQPYSPQTLRELFNAYGFQYEIYGVSESLLRDLSGGISPFPDLLLGGRGIMTSNRKPWLLAQTSFSTTDLATYTISRAADSPDFLCGETYRSKFKQDMKIGLRSGHIDYPEEGASLKMFVRALLFTWIRDSSRFLNFMNEFCHYIDPLELKSLNDSIMEVPFEYRADDEFQIRLMHALTPALMNLPVCSDHRPARINRKTFKLEFINVDKQSFLSRFASVLLPSSCIEPARELYHVVKGKKKDGGDVLRNDRRRRNQQIIETYGRQVMDDPLAKYWLVSTSSLQLKQIERLAHYLVGVNALGYLE